MSTQAETRHLREPGKDERFFIIRNALNYYNNVGMTAYITLSKINEEQFIPTIHHAIASTVQQHPMLTVTPSHDIQNTVSFSCLESIRLPDVLTCRTWVFNNFNAGHDKGLDAELEREHNRGFTSGLPQWRLLLIRDMGAEAGLIRFTFSFIYHHALGDGLSGLAFIRCFINSLQPPTSSPILRLVPVSWQPLPPNLEELINSVGESADMMVVSDQEKDRPAVSKVVPSSGESAPKVWLGSIPVNKVPASSRFISLTIPPHDTQRLRQICSARLASMTPLLQTIVAKSIFLAIPSEFDQLRGLCSLNLRPYLDNIAVQNSMGNYVGGFANIYNRKSFMDQETNLQGSGNETFWKEVKRTKDSISSAIDAEKKKIQTISSKPAGSSAKTQIPADMITWMQGLIGQPRVASFDINNLGTIALDQGVVGDVELGKVVFSASQSAIGSALKINIVTSPQGHMVIGLAWQHDIIEDDVIRKIAAVIKDLIDDLVAARDV